MAGKDLEQYLRAALAIADELDDEEQDVPWAFLRGRIPARDRQDPIGRQRLSVALDVVNVRTCGDLRRLRLYATGTGPLDQALRLRRAFGDKTFGPRETIESSLIRSLAGVTRQGSQAVDDLVDALNRAGFPRIGSIEHKWKRDRVVLPEGPIVLSCSPVRSSLALAEQRVVRPSVGPPADELLTRHFPRFQGYTSDAQRDAVHELLNPDGARHVLVRLPTGAGKSLLYLLPCAEWRRRGEPSTAVVVSPIIALQNDQVQKIERKYESTGLVARQINSTVSAAERTDTYRMLRKGKLDLLFLSPERVADPIFREILALAAHHVRMLVIDEAHIVDEWGQDFRPDFFRLGRERERLAQHVPELRTLFLSATITPDTESTLEQVFRLAEPPRQFIDPSLRTEVSIRVMPCKDEDARTNALQRLLEEVPLPCIVYCSKTDHVRELRRRLRDSGIRRCMDYMGPTAPDQRQARLRWFHDGDVDYVLATSAFGLGVDKADVRTVIHYDVPSSLDGYYQAVGRAARDGATGHAFLLYTSGSMGAATRENFAILTAERAIERAELMLHEREDLKWDGDGACIVPLHALPSKVNADSELNRKWNFAVLNILEQLGSIRVDGVVHRHVTVRRGKNATALSQFPGAEAVSAAVGTRAKSLDLLRLARKEHVALAVLAQLVARLVLERGLELVDEEDDSAEEWVLVHRDGDVTWSRRHTAAVEAHRQGRVERAKREVGELHAFLKSRGCRFGPIASVYRLAAPEPCGHCDRCRADLAF